jgi:dephospho-CoA kinase
MILVGITGIIGSGKSTVSRMLAEMGFPVTDLDRLAKEVSCKEEALAEVREVFGHEAVRDGCIDVERMKEIAFAGGETLRKLEEIIHPKVRAELFRRAAELEARNEGALIVDAPLLMETGLYKRMNKVVVVSVDPAKRRERLINRGMDPEDAERRLRFQIPLEQKERMADYVIRNNGTEENLRRDVQILANRIKTWEGEVDASK